MSQTLRAPYAFLGANGDYYIEANFGIRIYDNKGETIPEVGVLTATLKGGLRTNFIGNVPLLDGEKKSIGTAEVVQVICAKPENIDFADLQAAGFASREDAINYVATEHKEEFERDGVMTVYWFRVVERV